LKDCRRQRRQSFFSPAIRATPCGHAEHQGPRDLRASTAAALRAPHACCMHAGHRR
jgi:hypothetical protein